MGNLMSPTITREHGRMELLAYKEAGTRAAVSGNPGFEGTTIVAPPK